MQIESTTRDGVTIVAPAGVIDTRTAQAFEATMVQAFGGGARAFAVDFSRVTLITSAGIRVLVMMTHRLQRVSGGLVLFGLVDRVKMVFEIGGLLQQFRIVVSDSEAIELLSKPKGVPAPAAARPSRLASLLFDVTCGADALHHGLTQAALPPVPPSALTIAISDALGCSVPSGPAGPATG